MRQPELDLFGSSPQANEDDLRDGPGPGGVLCDDSGGLRQANEDEIGTGPGWAEYRAATTAASSK